MEHTTTLTVHSPEDPLSLADWRKQVAHLYYRIREGNGTQETWKMYLDFRAKMFLEHVQSPLDDEQKSSFKGLEFFEWNPNYRVVAKLIPAPKETFKVALPRDGDFTYSRIGKLQFTLLEQEIELGLYWVNGYGGGLFLPFRDKTCSKETYGGGRYLLDTIKGADIGGDFTKNEVILDFNYSYNPSCAYNSRYTCPLSPLENKISVSIEAGEKKFKNSK